MWDVRNGVDRCTRSHRWRYLVWKRQAVLSTLTVRSDCFEQTFERRAAFHDIPISGYCGILSPPHTHIVAYYLGFRAETAYLPRSWSDPNRCTSWPWWPRTVRNSTWRDRCRRSWPPQSCRWSWRTRRTRSCRRPLFRCRRRTRKPHLSRPGPAQPERNTLFKYATVVNRRKRGPAQSLCAITGAGIP